MGIQFFGLFLQCCMMTCSTSQGSPSSFFSSLCHQQLASCKFRLLLRRTFCSTSFSGFIKSHQHKSFTQLLNHELQSVLLVEGRLSVGAVLVSHGRHSFAFRHEHIVYVWNLVSNSQPFPCVGCHVAEAQAVDFGIFLDFEGFSSPIRRMQTCWEFDAFSNNSFQCRLVLRY